MACNSLNNSNCSSNLFILHVMKKVFANSWFNLLYVFFVAIMGFVANWTAWVAVGIYFLAWMKWADKTFISENKE